jgi:hypothetical protein
MPHFEKNEHQKISDKSIAIINLYAGFSTKILAGRTRIAHSEIARLLNLHPWTIAAVLDAFRLEEGQGDTVVLGDSMVRYADDAAFYALGVALDLPEEVMQPVLFALGHYQQMGEAA